MINNDFKLWFRFDFKFKESIFYSQAQGFDIYINLYYCQNCKNLKTVKSSFKIKWQSDNGGLSYSELTFTQVIITNSINNNNNQKIQLFQGTESI